MLSYYPRYMEEQDLEWGAKFLEDLYEKYINDPDIYEDLLGDLLDRYSYGTPSNDTLKRILKLSIEFNHYKIAHHTMRHIRNTDHAYFTKLFIRAIENASLPMITLMYQYLLIHPHYKKNLPLNMAIKYNRKDIVKLLMNNNMVLKSITPHMKQEFYANNEAYLYFISHEKVKKLHNKASLVMAIINNHIEQVKILANFEYELEQVHIKSILINNNIEMFKIFIDNGMIKNMDMKNCGFMNICVSNRYDYLSMILFILNSKLLTWIYPKDNTIV